MGMTALHALPVLLTLSLGQAAPGPKADGSKLPLGGIPRLVNEGDREVDQVIDRFILSDIGRLQGRAAIQAQLDFNRLDVRAVPALIRGLNRSANMQASCPVLVIGAKLNALAGFVEDPQVIALALKTIGEDVTQTTHQSTLVGVRDNFVRRQAVLVLGKLRERDLIARRLYGQGEEAARAALKDERPEFRWAAARVVAAKGLPCEAQLIELLTDGDREVRQEARGALVRLSHGLDFGPERHATGDDWALAARHWTTWVEARRTGTELAAASGPRRRELLDKLKDGKGMAYTQALAEVIPRLTGSAQVQARAALVERLTRMTARTLRAKLADENRDVRLATIAACIEKKSPVVVPPLIPLLEDPDPEIALGVHSALKKLTGEDFGPGRAVTRAEAVRAWRAWCAGRGG